MPETERESEREEWNWRECEGVDVPGVCRSRRSGVAVVAFDKKDNEADEGGKWRRGIKRRGEESRERGRSRRERSRRERESERASGGRREDQKRVCATEDCD